ncbi:tripartite motif-containing protein 45-like [Dreissena polymorpha]|uniref:B box-type domain-containing protein n=1 Tax=Dreissena polymorpha TaxID=45954 RepID=A0A9D4FBE5_DREPO|nr:tripartite motif-containing protein 45-like [Dreissena polymorpha]KAH3792737.1 hypothetical protein DPMN_146236 [Dreissena polymorpha]
MAASFETSHNKESDKIYNLCCSVCEEDSTHKEGLFYCKKCSKIVCNECVLMHNKIHEDHSVSAKGKCDNFPVTVDDTLELCEEHSTEKLTMFCEDHEKLLCQLCLFHNNHRQCSHVVLLAEKCKTSTELKVDDIATNIEQLQKRLVETMNKIEQNINSLQTSYESILKEILDFRRKINDSLDRLQQQTVNELEKLQGSFKNSLDNERKQCAKFISKLKVHHTNSIRSPEQSFILNRKYQDQNASVELFIQTATNAGIEYHFNNDFGQFIAACTDLGKITTRVGGVVSPQHIDPNKAINVQEKSQFNLRTSTDPKKCSITGICEISNGNLFISDGSNMCVKLLDQAHNVLDQVKLTAHTWSMCKISPNEVAVTVSNPNSVNEIDVLRVDTGKIIQSKTLKLNHLCYGIAHHKGDMFVTSGTSLFKYATDGRLVKKLYDDKTAKYSVVGVAVSPNGNRIYLTDRHNGRLVTLNIDGAVTSTIHDPAFKRSWITCNIHVAATGHVFVFDGQTVTQVDTDGKKCLATFVIDGVISVVYFNVDGNKLLVGKFNNDNMSEFKAKRS